MNWALKAVAGIVCFDRLVVIVSTNVPPAFIDKNTRIKLTFGIGFSLGLRYSYWQCYRIHVKLINSNYGKLSQLELKPKKGCSVDFLGANHLCAICILCERKIDNEKWWDFSIIFSHYERWIVIIHSSIPMDNSVIIFIDDIARILNEVEFIWLFVYNIR